MAPITLFDKSFLQSLSLDESVWFDHFFHAMISPLFYIETLADLDKSARAGKTPEDEVSIIAGKFPEVHGSPSSFHLPLCISSLLRYDVPMRRGIPTFSGRPVIDNGKIGVVMKLSPEAEAFNRWANKEFFQVEHQYAQAWRNQLASIDLTETAKQLRLLGIDSKSCKTLASAKAIAENIVNGSDKTFERMKLACLMLRVPRESCNDILKKWSQLGSPAISSYAPYAAYVLTVEVFFQIALAANLISTDRASNLIDIAYLSYLPFCDVFVSNDHLHAKCAPLFLRKDQLFIIGADMKKGLKELNEHFSQLPEHEQEEGISSFAKFPPKSGNFFVSEVWDKFYPGWRAKKEINPKNVLSPEQIKKILSMNDAPTAPREKIDFNSQNFDKLSITRKVHSKKGKWYQVPKNLKT